MDCRNVTQDARAGGPDQSVGPFGSKESGPQECSLEEAKVVSPPRKRWVGMQIESRALSRATRPGAIVEMQFQQMDARNELEIWVARRIRRVQRERFKFARSDSIYSKSGSAS